MLLEKALVGCGVVVGGDGDDLDLREVALELLETGQFLGAGSAPACPEVQHDDVPVELVEIDGVLAVIEREHGSAGAELLGVTAAIAAGEGNNEERSGREECGYPTPDPACTEAIDHPSYNTNQCPTGPTPTRRS